MKALEIYSHTLLGISGEFPIIKGNCFSVLTDEINKDTPKDPTRRILNYNFENLKELIKRGIIDFPIEITPYKQAWAYITDPRIPEEWNVYDYCRICGPKKESIYETP